MELSGLQIFKYLPAAKKAENSNCKKCGCPTCMAFALKLAKKQVEISNCPYAPQDLKEFFEQNSKQPQNTIEINGLKIGGENVLYRHEKTFVNKTAIAILIDTELKGWQEKLKRVRDFEITRVSETMKIDLVILKGEAPAEFTKGLNVISYEEFKSLPVEVLEDKDFKTTREKLIEIRTKAIKEKDEKYAKPVCVIMHGEGGELCARASFYICKYANMLIFDKFDEALI